MCCRFTVINNRQHCEPTILEWKREKVNHIIVRSVNTPKSQESLFRLLFT
jgi:hypothetical protein